MAVKASHSEVHTIVPDPPYDQTVGPWDAGPIFELIKCPACGKINLATHYWDDFADPPDSEYQVVYPTERGIPEGLPQGVHTAYTAALSVRAVDANAFAVLLGRVLEKVCVDRGATGRTLADQLRGLSSKHEIPDKLADVARGLRHLRNVGAHAGLGELTDSEVPILDDLTRAILEYVYSAPLLARKAETRLADLKRRRGGDPSTDVT